MRSPCFRMAFTMVEVVLAMAIISFCCVTLLGLLSVGYSSARSSTDDSQVAMLYEQIIRQFQLKPFAQDTTRQVLVEGSPILPLPALGGTMNAANSLGGSIGAVDPYTYTSNRTNTFMVDDNNQYTTNIAKAQRFVTITVNDPVPDLSLDEVNIPVHPPSPPVGYLAQVKVVISWPAAAAQSAFINPRANAVVTSSTFVTEIGTWEDQDR